MSVSRERFDSAVEAIAFAEGINYVNDSSLIAFPDKDDPCVVVINDDDIIDEEEPDNSEIVDADFDEVGTVDP